MNTSALQQTIPARPVWRMPIRPERYDRSPLSDVERTALAVLVNGDAPLNSSARRKGEATLGRLIRPLHEVYALRRVDASTRPQATRVMLGQMHRRSRSFWQWSAQEWCDVVDVTAESFEAANGLPPRREGLRPHVLDVAYLLCGFEQFGPIWTATAFYPMARVVFGADVLEAQIARLDAVLADNGYSTGLVSVKQRHQAMALVLLLNRSPWLDDLSWAALDRAASRATAHAASIILGRIAKALVLLGIIAPADDSATLSSSASCSSTSVPIRTPLVRQHQAGLVAIRGYQPHTG
jgi:hypothetical protein